MDKQKPSPDYTSLLIAGVLLVAASQAIERVESPAAQFIRGVAVGLAIACCVIGLVLYAWPRS